MIRLLPLVLTACALDAHVDLPFCEQDGRTLPEVAAVDEPVTWWEHVQPLMAEHCVGCHTEGGLAPVSLDAHADAQLWREAIAHAVEYGTMPPFIADDCCGREYSNARGLSPEEVGTILAWADAGAPEGDPALAASDPEVGPSSGLSRVDLTLRMPEPYAPTATVGDDDVRCFLLDWPLDEEMFVTGVDFVPGDRSIVHHVIGFVVDEDHTSKLERIDASDEGPGWDCYSGLDVRAAGAVGGWVPGQEGFDYPDGIGRKVGPDSKIVLNVHYDLSVAEDGAADQSEMLLTLDATADHELTGVAVGHPLWLFGDAMAIPEGEADTSYAFSYDPTPLYFTKAMDLWNVNMHMHTGGSAATVAVLRQDGAHECLVHIAEWDFAWQNDFWFAEPVRIERGDELYVECHWDNSEGASDPYGEDVAWGTDEEMCGAILLATVVDE